MKLKKHIAEQYQLAGVPTEDQEMGAQITKQYNRAVGGMIDVVILGAMMLRLREYLVNNSTRGVVRTGGKKSKETGIKAWLREFAPEVKESTAYRFMAVAEAVQESYKIPAKAQKTLGFAGFVTADPEQLPEPLRAKQAALFDYVTGTSQRSWLDRLRPTKAKGGDITPRDKDGKRVQLPSTAEEKAQAQAQVYYGNLYLELYKARTGKTKDLQHLPYATDKPADEASLTTLLEELELLASQVKEVIAQKRA